MTRLPRRLPFASALVAALVAGIVLAGCGAAGLTLDGREFLSVAVTDGGAARPLVAGTRIRLSFDADQIGVSAGCNHMGGTYRIDGVRLVVEGGASTEMACEEPLMAQDQFVTTFLASGPSILLVGPDLTLTSGSVTIRLVDRTVADPDQPLVGPTWTVTSILVGDTASSIPAGAVASLTFAADGTATVSTGCNEGSARWSALDPGIRVTDIVLTKRACVGPGAELEAAVLGLLRAGSLDVSISAGSLTLRAGDRGLQLQAGSST